MSLLSSLTPLIVGIVVLGVAVEMIPGKSARRRDRRRRPQRPIAHAAQPFEPPPAIVVRPLMTDREIGFWRTLRAAAHPLHVAPQVAMGALIDIERGVSPSARTTARNAFDRQVVDFVLIDDVGQVRLLVELDDRTHSSERDEARDWRTAQAGYLTLRISGQPSAAQLQAMIAERIDAADSYPSSRAASRA